MGRGQAFESDEVAHSQSLQARWANRRTVAGMQRWAPAKTQRAPSAGPTRKEWQEGRGLARI